MSTETSKHVKLELSGPDFTMAGRADGELWIVKRVNDVLYDIFMSRDAQARIIAQIDWNMERVKHQDVP